jgi:DNA-binding MarR family transcriptional regulator
LDKRRIAQIFICMEESIFNPASQIGRLDFKIVAALERLGEAFRVLLWNEAKELNLSPIQIQILIFVKYHPDARCKVSHLATEFNMTKPTISDAVRVLEQKGLIRKETEPDDTRSYVILLTEVGEEVVRRTAGFGAPMVGSLSQLSENQKIVLLESLLEMIFRLQKAGIVSLQRMCFSCRFFENSPGGYYCTMLQKRLEKQDLRVDCPEFEPVEITA